MSAIVSFALSFLPALKSPKVIISGILLLLVAAILGLGYLHYTGVVEDNARLRANQARLEDALSEEKRTSAAAVDAVADWARSAKTISKSLEALAVNQREAAAEGRRLNELFSKHDLAAVARARPDLAQRSVNSATARALRLLECASSGDHDCPGADSPADGAAPPRP